MSVSGIGGAAPTAAVHHPKAHTPKATPVATPAAAAPAKSAVNKTA